MNADEYYKKDGKPIVAPSYCLVADLLGLKRRVRSCNSYEESNDLCQHIFDIFSEFKKQVEEGEDRRPWSYVVFSDTVVLGYPITCTQDYAEPELGGVLDFVKEFQLHMTRQGFLVRGGLSFGELHISDDHCFGKALVVAHELEKKHGMPPRIVAFPAVRKLVELHLEFYSNPGQAPQVSAFLRDIQDDSFFVNYLDWLDIDEGTELDWLEGHKIFLISLQEKYAEDAEIKKKLDWAVAYHNFFCTDQIVGNENWQPSSEEIEGLMIGDGIVARGRFGRIAESSSVHISVKTRLPSPDEWPEFDE